MNLATPPFAGLNSLDLPDAPADTRIVVAMSGGVDSSVVAGLLAQQGYDVVGVTLQLYDYGPTPQRKGACCAGQDIHDARRVAERLDIPHYVLDYEDKFRQSVIDDFADSYLAGETPIPCVRCNQGVKFTDLLATARDLGAQALATGHYIQSRRVDPAAPKREMFRAIDEDRDQSYFLFATTQEQLDFLRFPLGSMTKAETRAHAAALGLSIADKPDSQDICFVPNGRYSDVIAKLRPDAAEPGDIVDLDGNVLGRHDGVLNYTIGQRRGLGIAAEAPLYVVKLDPGSRIVTVGPRDALLIRDITLRDVNWLGNDGHYLAKTGSMDIFAKIRSTRPPAPARLSLENGAVKVRLIEGDYGVSPGQACVFYDGQGPGARVFGGGWISHTEQSMMAKRALRQQENLSKKNTPLVSLSGDVT